MKMMKGMTDLGEAGPELLGCAVGHGSQQVHGGRLAPPRRVLQRLEDRRQHQLHTVGAATKRPRGGGKG
jgi:hypothetical protein